MTEHHPIILAFYSTRMQAGKTVTATELCRTHGFEPVKFAGPLKDMVRSLLHSMGYETDMIERMVEGDLKEMPLPDFENVTPRFLMQTIGSEWGRETIDHHIWIKISIAKIHSLISKGINVVIDDLRFPNEYKELKKLDAKIIKVNRPGYHIESRPHPSESRLEDMEFDAELINDSTIQALHAQIEPLLEKMLSLEDSVNSTNPDIRQFA